jgi:hypothetical protein
MSGKAQLKKTPMQYKPGDTVIFTPTGKMRNWAAGVRTVAGVYGEFIRLECGNIKLLATKEELRLVKSAI